MKRNYLVLVFVGLTLILLLFTLFSSNATSINNNQKGNNQKGVLTLAFDDGLESQYDIAFKKMQDYGYKGNLFILANQTGFLEDRKLMNFEQAREMQDYGWEIGSHGMSHTFLNEKNLNYQLVQSKEVLSSKGFVINSFSCPYGCNESIKELRKIGEENYKVVLSLDWGENDLNSYNTKRLNSKWVNNINTPEEICKWIEDAKKNNKWLILRFHGIDESENPNHHYDISLENFEKVLKCINDSKIEVKTIKEVLGYE